MKHFILMLQLAMMLSLSPKAFADFFCYTPDTHTRLDISVTEESIQAVEISEVDLDQDILATIASMSVEKGNLKALPSGAQLWLRHSKSQVNKQAQIEERSLAQIQWLEFHMGGETEPHGSLGEQFEGRLKMTLRNGRSMTTTLTCFNWLKE